MINQDTIRLLRECDAGIQMGTSAIEDVLDRIQDKKLYRILSACRDEHRRLEQDVRAALNRFQDEGKSPNPVAKTMSALKTGMELTMNPSDSTIASLMTDGCAMGVKSLCQYLNEYKAADEHAKDLCKKLIALEDQLARDLRAYL